MSDDDSVTRTTYNVDHVHVVQDTTIEVQEGFTLNLVGRILVNGEELVVTPPVE